jgi:hypothetical protein
MREDAGCLRERPGLTADHHAVACHRAGLLEAAS